MSNEKLQSISLIDAPQCSYEEAPVEDAVCEDKAKYHEDTVNHICSQDVIVTVEYRETEKGIEEIVKLDEKKALARKAKSFADKPKTKKEKQKEVASTGKPEVPPEIFRVLESSPERGSCVDATPATAPTPVILFSVNLNFQGALFYLQDQEPAKVQKKKDGAVEPEGQPIEVAFGDRDLARTVVREERAEQPVPMVQASELFPAENRQNISGGEVFSPILNVLEAEIVSPKPEAVSEKKEGEKKEEKKERQLQTVTFVSQDGVLSAPEIFLQRQVMEEIPSPSTPPTSVNIFRHFFPTDPAVSGVLVFPFALPFVQVRGVVTLNGPGIKLAFTRVNPGSSAHGQQGRQGSRQGKGGQRSFQ